MCKYSRKTSFLKNLERIQCKKKIKKIISELIRHCRRANGELRFSLPVITVVLHYSKTLALPSDTSFVAINDESCFLKGQAPGKCGFLSVTRAWQELRQEAGKLWSVWLNYLLNVVKKK